MSRDPGPIEPDGKDWTWVLHRECPECGFRATEVRREDVAAMLRDNAREWADILAEPAARVRARPRPTVWSALEYAAHVRDVHRLYLERLDLMLAGDGPRYPNWDQDQTAVAERYHESDPAAVSAELVEAAHALAERFDTIAGDDWARTGYRSDGAEFTVESFARYFIHDPIHHTHDVRKGFALLVD